MIELQGGYRHYSKGPSLSYGNEMAAMILTYPPTSGKTLLPWLALASSELL